MKATIIIGMPGSGKTSLMWRMKEDITHAYAAFFDNIYANNSCAITAFNRALDERRPVIVSDILFCDSKVLDRFVIGHVPSHYSLELIYFLNDPAQCRINAMARGSKHLPEQLRLIKKLAKDYHPWGDGHDTTAAERRATSISFRRVWGSETSPVLPAH